MQIKTQSIISAVEELQERQSVDEFAFRSNADYFPLLLYWSRAAKSPPTSLVRGRGGNEDDKEWNHRRNFQEDALL